MVSDICFLLIVCADTLLGEDQNEVNNLSIQPAVQLLDLGPYLPPYTFTIV